MLICKKPATMIDTDHRFAILSHWKETNHDLLHRCYRWGHDWRDRHVFDCSEQRGEEMRLIDADMLCTDVRVSIRHPYKRREDVEYVDFDQIDNMPTIEAIPIDWLYERIEGLKKSGFNNEASAVEIVLDVWKARNDDVCE